MRIHRGGCWRLIAVALLGGLTACAMIKEPSPAPSAGTVRRPRPATPQEPQAPGFVSPLLAFGGDNELYLMWASGVLHRKQNDVHFSRSVDDGLTWDTHKSLKADPTRNTGGRQIVADRNGNVMAYWGAGLRTGNIDVVAARSGDHGANWTPPQGLYKGEIHVPSLITGPNGEYFSIIPEGPESNWRLVFSRSADGGKIWEQLPTLNGTLGTDSQFGIRSSQIVADRHGRLHVVWQERGRGQRERIYYNRLDPANVQGAWLSEAVQLSAGEADSSGAYRPQISVDADGHLFVAWVEAWDPGNAALGEGQHPQSVYFTRSMDGGRTWLAQPIRLSHTGPEALRHVATHVEVANDGKGRIYVAWREEVGFPRVERLVFQGSTDYGATWISEPRSLREIKPFPAIHARFHLKSGENGRVYLLWQMAGFAWDLLFMQSTDGGMTWSKAPIRLATLPQTDPGAHDVAFETRGSHLYVAWDIGPKLPSEIFLNRSTDFGRTWLTREVQVTKREP